MTQQQPVKIVRFPVPILGILGFVFIYLKVANYVDWSWLWVLAPFWGPFAFGLTLLTVFFVISAIGAVVAALISTRGY